MAGTQRELTFRFLAEPTDVNFGGKVHGGAVMKWIDQAGYACAAGWAGSYCVTVYVGGIQFERPIQVGQIVEVRAQLVHTGSTSMHVAVDVAGYRKFKRSFRPVCRVGGGRASTGSGTGRTFATRISA